MQTFTSDLLWIDEVVHMQTLVKNGKYLKKVDQEPWWLFTYH
jgi:hypothetical protein